MARLSTFRISSILCIVYFLLLLIPPAQAADDLSRIRGCWFGYMDIAFYGGKAYFGLEFDAGRRGRPLLSYHRITDESERWTTKRVNLEGDKIFIRGPGGQSFDLTIAGDSMAGVYRGRDVEIPVSLRFSPDITAAKLDPDFFKIRPYSYRVPPQLEDGLISSTLRDVAMDPTLIRTLIEDINSEKFKNIRSFLLVKDGKLVVEEYFWQQTQGGFPYLLGAEDGQNIYSATRTFTAALLGMAVDSGLIAGPQEKIAGFFPESPGLFDSPEKTELTLEHLLTMESGLQWEAADIAAYQPHYDPIRSPAGQPIIAFVLGRKVQSLPGKTFHYNNELSTIIGEAVRRRFGQLLPQLARQYLFAPLKIEGSSWFTYPDGVAAAGNGLRLKPRDMAKFALLFLREGLWEGRPLLSREWIAASLSRYTDISDPAYGYHWWLDTFVVSGRRIEAASARGHYGQFIFIVPSLDLGAVFTSASDGSHLWDQPVDMMARYILPAFLPPAEPPPAPEIRAVDTGDLKRFEGIYRFAEDRFGIIGFRKGALYYKPPGRSYVRLSPTFASGFVSADGGLTLHIEAGPQAKGKILTVLSGNVEEQARDLAGTPEGTEQKSIFFFPWVWLRIFFWIYILFLVAGGCGILARLFQEKTKRTSLTSAQKISRTAAVWAALGGLGSLTFVKLLLDSGNALEEIVNLGATSFGWDERGAVLAFFALTLGSAAFALRHWLRRTAGPARRLFYAILPMSSLILMIKLWAVGLIPRLLQG